MRLTKLAKETLLSLRGRGFLEMGPQFPHATVRALKRRGLVEFVPGTLTLIDGTRFWLTEDGKTVANAVAIERWGEGHPNLGYLHRPASGAP